MPFLMVCDCGKRYRVADEYKGRKLKCAACGAHMRAAEVERLAAAAPPPPVVRLSPAAWGPFPTRVTALWAAYPLVPTMLCVLAAILTAAAGWLNLWLTPLGLAPLAGLWFHFSSLKGRYSAVALRPAQIVSVTPPLLAVLHDAAGGESDAVLKIFRAPLAAFTSGQPQAGVRAPLLVQQPAGGGDADFAIEYPARLTHRPADLAQAAAAIPATDWQCLQTALDGLMVPEPGLFSAPLAPPHESLPARAALEQVVAKELGHDPARGHYLATGGIAPPVLAAASESFAPGLDHGDVLALVKCQGDATGRHALLFCVDALRFKVNDKFASDLFWTDLWTVGRFGDELELVYASGIRMRIPTGPFAASAPAVARVLARIARGG